MYILYWLILFHGVFQGIPIMHGGRVEGKGKHPIKGMGRKAAFCYRKWTELRWQKSFGIW